MNLQEIVECYPIAAPSLMQSPKQVPHCCALNPLSSKKSLQSIVISANILLNAFLLRQETVLHKYTGGIKLIGSGKSKETYELRDFMEKNHIWHTFIDVDQSENAIYLLRYFHLNEDDIPILINHKNEVCKHPSLDDLARSAGILTDFEDRTFDLLIIGAGPAGFGS